MEISMLTALLNNISSFIQVSSFVNIRLDPVQKYYHQAEEILKLLITILNAIIDSEIASNEVLTKAFEELGQSVDELRELFENWQPLSSKIDFALQAESSISKIRTLGLDSLLTLISSHEHLPDELNSSSLEYCIQKIKQMDYEQTSSIIKEAIRDQLEGVGPSSEILVKIAESLSLRSNQEVLIEAVALEKLKENAEQAEKAGEAEDIEQKIALVTRMHERLIQIKQSQTCSPVPIPADFCCPLSLELMTDPVIVASGQTYERAFIKIWIDLGLTVCPKTRQTLAHTNLIPNYTVKALIANWCELNNVKLPDPTRSVSLSQPVPLLVHSEFTASKDWQGLDIARLSQTSSEERSTNSEDGNIDSVGPISASPSRNEVSNTVRTEEPMFGTHNRSTSVSSTVHAANVSQGGLQDANESSESSNHLTSYSRDTSGEVKAELQASTALNTTQREPDFSPRLLETRSRSQTIWRRPSDRLVPRIVSSPAMGTRADLSGVETRVRELVEDLKSTSLDTQRDATGELRQLAKHNMDNRIVIANCGAISLLVDLLRSEDSETQANAVTALLNLSINDNNKTAIANAGAIEPLIHVLERGSSEAKENSAATLFSLSVIEDNKVRIGRSGAIEPLVDLLGNGTPRGKKDAATALFNLSIFHENKARIVQAGAVKYLVELMDPAAGMVDKAVAVLANLATIPEGRTAIGQANGISVLVEVVELGSARGKENAAAALLQLCTSSSRFCNMVLQEGAVPPLVALSQSGTPRAKEKAQALLSYFRNQRHGNAGRG